MGDICPQTIAQSQSPARSNVLIFGLALQKARASRRG
jgi:hypothetical protein